MSSLPPFFDMFCEEILHQESNDNVRSNSDVESQVAYPKMGEAFSFDCFSHCVEDVFVRHLSLSVWLHLLQFGLCVVKGQTRERGNDS